MHTKPAYTEDATALCDGAEQTRLPVPDGLLSCWTRWDHGFTARQTSKEPFDNLLAVLPDTTISHRTSEQDNADASELGLKVCMLKRH
jgi:hypothetical protein